MNEFQSVYFKSRKTRRKNSQNEGTVQKDLTNLKKKPAQQLEQAGQLCFLTMQKAGCIQVGPAFIEYAQIKIGLYPK